MDSVRIRSEKLSYQNLPTDRRDRVSIPIATYDRIDLLLDRTLPALLNQSYENIEVIVIGDGTDPRLFSRLREITDRRFVPILLKNRTRYPRDLLHLWMVAGWRPRNIGMKAATGGWLFWMSDDDEILPHGISSLVHFANENPSLDVVSGGYRIALKEPVLRLPSQSPLTDFPATCGMPALMARSYTKALKWNGWSHLKSWNRPSDYDLLERMSRLNLIFGGVDEVVAVVHPLEGTQLTGSRAFECEYKGAAKTARGHVAGS